MASHLSPSEVGDGRGRLLTTVVAPVESMGRLSRVQGGVRGVRGGWYGVAAKGKREENGGAWSTGGACKRARCAPMGGRLRLTHGVKVGLGSQSQKGSHESSTREKRRQS